MELSDLNYFLAVAAVENMNQAAKNAGVSPGALSKAVARLESDLDVALFNRVKQRIVLTPEGLEFALKARRIMELVDESRVAVGSKKGLARIVIGGDEALAGRFCKPLVDRLPAWLQQFEISVKSNFAGSPWEALKQGAIHLLISTEPREGFPAIKIGQTAHRVMAHREHPLATDLRQIVPIDELLCYDFAVPHAQVFGLGSSTVSTDGWRDDQFPRLVKYRLDSLHSLLQLVLTGEVLAYLPDYLEDTMGLKTISVSGCPYVCERDIYINSYQPDRLGWLHHIFS